MSFEGGLFPPKIVGQRHAIILQDLECSFLKHRGDGFPMGFCQRLYRFAKFGSEPNSEVRRVVATATVARMVLGLGQSHDNYPARIGWPRSIRAIKVKQAGQFTK